jgi:hypothetical protein
MTEREHKIILASLSMARGILIRHGKHRGLEILDYQMELEKAWGIDHDPKYSQEILEDVNSAIFKIHPDWVKDDWPKKN